VGADGAEEGLGRGEGASYRVANVVPSLVSRVSRMPPMVARLGRRGLSLLLQSEKSQCMAKLARWTLVMQRSIGIKPLILSHFIGRIGKISRHLSQHQQVLPFNAKRCDLP
jgi:hypothetical protein